MQNGHWVPINITMIDKLGAGDQGDYRPRGQRGARLCVRRLERVEGKKQPLTAAFSGLRILANSLLTLVLLRSSYVAGRIHPHPRARSRPRRRNLDPGAHPQRPGQPSLWPHPSGNRSNVANRPAPHAHPAAQRHWNLNIFILERWVRISTALLARNREETGSHGGRGPKGVLPHPHSAEYMRARKKEISYEIQVPTAAIKV